ncbi:MAG: hypothetical protein HJHJAOHD_01718 [Flavobacteriales bacterium]|nr:hypothetical protein [Flavobacteriales bacterium]MCL4817202.1 SET domain-containing protein-lysine N-methyltransferase [Flavobacteriales bacterium]WKZ74068.1 MAG: SET domain-containing protein-lysine N-methyltransferase [Vicingaceae bacterium]
MIHPHTELRIISETVGYGIFANKRIPKGTITYIKDELELVFKPTDIRLKDKKYFDIIERFSYIDNKGNRILSWDLSKYVNHSCNANTMSTGYDFEIALRDIEAGEQLTDEYGIFNLITDMHCECGEPNCRKTIRKNDFDIFYKEWDTRIKQSLSFLKKVEQPLLPFMDQKTKEQLEKYLQEGKPYKSVYNLRLKKELNGLANPHELNFLLKHK